MELWTRRVDLSTSHISWIKSSSGTSPFGIGGVILARTGAPFLVSRVRLGDSVDVLDSASMGRALQLADPRTCQLSVLAPPQRQRGEDLR